MRSLLHNMGFYPCEELSFHSLTLYLTGYIPIEKSGSSSKEGKSYTCFKQILFKKTKISFTNSTVLTLALMMLDQQWMDKPNYGRGSKLFSTTRHTQFKKTGQCHLRMSLMKH